ncbi:MAG: hypothetical protein HOH66_05620 [Rhodospirillaceae bacterium]|jgi:hypothetical protein|nr:hypothetical protein [Rhodospirillaceae bacterium]
MRMPEPLAPNDGLAPLVAFVEDTAPERIVEETIRRLRDGTSPRDLLAAAAVAVSRATEVPFDHHGGPLHMVTGIRAVDGAAGRLRGDWAFLPIVHSVHLANQQVHSSAMGPHVMAELGDGGLAGDAAAAGLADAIRDQLPVVAERHLRAVLRDGGPAATLAVILEAALWRHALDDHFLLYPVFAAQTLDLIGWDKAEFVLRPVVRWLASPPLTLIQGDGDPAFFKACLGVYGRFGELEGLIVQHGLLDNPPPVATGPAEDNAVADLGARIGAITDFDTLPPMMAEALAAGMSMEGVVEALSMGAATIHLRTDYGNPLDVHMHNGVSVRRYLIGLADLPLRLKLIALLSWAFGPEIRLSQEKIAHEPHFDTAGLPEDADGLLAALESAVEKKPPVDDAVFSGGGRAGMTADEGARHVMALAQKYAECGHDPDALLRRLTEIVCRDSFTEMHAFEHMDDAAREFAKSRQPHGAAHLVSAAKIAYCGHGIDQTVFEAARPHLSL